MPQYKQTIISNFIKTIIQCCSKAFDTLPPMTHTHEVYLRVCASFVALSQDTMTAIDWTPSQILSYVLAIAGCISTTVILIKNGNPFAGIFALGAAGLLWNLIRKSLKNTITTEDWKKQVYFLLKNTIFSCIYDVMVLLLDTNQGPICHSLALLRAVCLDLAKESQQQKEFGWMVFYGAAQVVLSVGMALCFGSKEGVLAELAVLLLVMWGVMTDFVVMREAVGESPQPHETA